MSYPDPSERQLRAAFRDHGVPFVVHPRCRSRNGWGDGLRAATVHHTAGVDSADYLATAWSLPGANVVVNNGKYNGLEDDGRVEVLGWGSVYHSGDGGPWPGVAGRDSLHLVSWGIEVESRGTSRDITDAQVESVGRMLAALIDLGMPARNVHRHADWTDGTGPVGGYPLATVGRKIDTRADLGYTTEFWRDQAAFWVLGEWDGVTPGLASVAEGGPKALWRLQARLFDLGYRRNPPVAPVENPEYPARSVAAFQARQGWEGSGEFTARTQRRLFGEEKP